jgi:ATP-binding cassette subfamily B (MDR/TAP) protein 1
MAILSKIEGDSVAVATEEEEEEVSNIEIKTTERVGKLSELFQFAEPIDWAAIAVGSLGGILTGFSLPFFNVMFGIMLDELNDDPMSFGDRIADISLIFVYTAIANLATCTFQVGCWTYAGERMAQKFRQKYVKAILSQEIGWFDVNGASSLSTKTLDLSGKVQDGLTRKASDLFQFGSQFVGSFAVAIYLCWELTVVLLAAFPLIGFAGAFMIDAVTSATTGSGENYALAGGLASESLTSIRTVTALNAQPNIISRYRIYLLEAMQIGIKKGLKVGLGNGGLFCAAFFTYALGFWYGGNLVADAMDEGNAELTGGTVLAVFFCVIMGSIALGQVVPPLSGFIGAKASIGPMLDVIERVPEIDGFSDKGLIPEGAAKGEITLKDVTFAYPSRPNIDVCKSYSLSIAPGETVALVGASGSGKSTIINLLLRFYDPQAGAVCLDGNNISDLNIKWLRSQIGLVSQEPILFSGTIKDNIGYGIKDGLGGDTQLPANYDERIIEAAKLANAHEFISNFPQGYDTDVGTGGVAMSGGQKQRIAIARALVKKPALLLLDEATSALDATSEKMVQESIDALQASKAQTTVVVAHRLSTIRSADKIALVSNGQIAELGTHDQLIAKKGLYADLVSLQMDDDNDLEDGVDGYEEKQRERKLSESIAKTASKDADDAKKSGEKGEDIEEAKVSDVEAAELTKKIRGLLMKHPVWIAVALVGAGTFGAMFPVWGLILARTQDMFYNTNTDEMRDEASEVSLQFLGLGCVALVFSTLQFWGSAQVCERVSMRLRSDLFEALVRREIGFFDPEENSAGALLARLSDDSRCVTKAMGDSIPRMLQAFFTLAVGLGLGINASWKIALVVLATFPVSIFASALQMAAFAGQQYGASSGETGSVSTAFNNMRTVTSFSMQFRIADEFEELTQVQVEERIIAGVKGGAGFGLAQMTTFCIYALLFWYGSQLIEEGEVDFQDMMTAIMSLMLGALGLGTAFGDLGDQNEGVKAAKRIFDAVDAGQNSAIDALSTDGERPSERLKGKIELRGVNFSYPTRPDAVVCKDYNLVVNPGEVVALVGPSGGGKSTIMNLLMRFYDPASGEVLLDDKPIKDLNVRWLRSQVGYVGQEPVLFSGSIASNISKGRSEFGESKLISLDEAMIKNDEDTAKGVNCITEVKDAIFSEGLKEGTNSGEPAADIVDATTQSNAHEFISKFTNGYRTDVGEGSMMVSGGQKQRIAIARALVKKPALLLLDEATSALDAASEKMVQESIDALQASKAQTTLVIAHRLTTIKNADKIAVIDKGSVVAVGTHEQLLADENGLYTHLWNKQQGRKGKSSDNLAALVDNKK